MLPTSQAKRGRPLLRLGSSEELSDYLGGALREACDRSRSCLRLARKVDGPAIVFLSNDKSEHERLHLHACVQERAQR